MSPLYFEFGPLCEESEIRTFRFPALINPGRTYSKLPYILNSEKII